ncbi:MAG: DegV family protein [Clostridiales bacterium]|uniref:DegV family protein n=1 Tax=Anaerocaecibacter muris TaxID=2941513 RepID=UPI00203D27D7|nr:DegV family protein [Anaerocaecibacter muris]MDE6966758.1 DegV family protein [Clostridiales bacterium]
MRFTLSTDTVCDVFKSELKARGIDYVSTYYTVDGVEHKDEITSDDEIKEFYDKIRGGEMPTTSQVTQNDYEEFFGNLINKCDGDIVHVTISSGLTSSPLSARYVAEQIYEKTGRRIYIVDSLGATIATRHIVDEAERLRDADVPAEQAVERLNDMVNHIHTWFMPTDLMHLKRGGRVSGPSAYIGTALNIKPILQFDASGALVVKQKKIGAGKGIAAMIDIFKTTSAKQPHKVYIASADSDLAEGMLKKAQAARPDCDIEIAWIGPVIGAHTGVNAVGISFLSDSVRE